MQILKQRGVTGMVEYFEAAEIPAMVVMEWVDGADLRKAVLGKVLHTWQDILRCAKELASILHTAHSLPERVLHRDVRPANIMLDGLGKRAKWKVKVLDFDLSWHQGGLDRTIIHTPGATGYLAPEQIQKIPGVSTRHSAVDSFGLGMTLFFMAAGRDPFLTEHQHKDWAATVQRACDGKPSEWKCLATRYARLVLGATQHEQHKRPDMTSLSQELSRLEALSNGKDVYNRLDILAEEIASRCDLFNGYEWREDTTSAVKDLQSFTYAEIKANLERNRISFTIRRQSKPYGNQNRKLNSAIETARKMLRDGGWKPDRHDVQSMEMNIVAHWYPHYHKMTPSDAAYLLDRVSQTLYV